MPLSIKPINPARPDFVGEVSGIDIARGVSAETAAAIEDGMDRFAVLVFHDQRLTDDQQYAFSEHFGPMEIASGDLVEVNKRRLDMRFNDISNLNKDGALLERDDRRRLFS